LETGGIGFVLDPRSRAAQVSVFCRRRNLGAARPAEPESPAERDRTGGRTGASPPPLGASAERVILVGYALGAGLVAIQTVIGFVNAFGLDARHIQLDPDEENTVWAWLSVVATFSVAFAAFVLSTFVQRRNPAFVTLAVLACYLSLDDAVQLHERIGHRVGEAIGLDRYGDRILQPFLVLPVAAVVFVLVWRLTRDAARPIELQARVGLALLVCGLAAEAVARVAELDPPEAANYVEVMVEEGLELGGWVLIAAALTGSLLVYTGLGRDSVGSPEHR
jgi:hypothetical protein